MTARPPRLIGMIHLLPLPGSPSARPMIEVLERALADAEALTDAGFEAVMIENFGDAPFHKDRVLPITVAAMTRVVSCVRSQAGDVQVGVNVLRNDARAALAVAAAAGASAIRVNIHCGARVTDQGVVEGRADETLRLRAAWGSDVAIWADVAVKHSAPLGPARPIVHEAKEVVGRGGADALILSGFATGASVDRDALGAVRAAVGSAPILLGSGVTAETVGALLEIADGAIVGTSIKMNGITTAPVDPVRARELVRAAG